jgi:hypothetical protein
MPRPAFLPDAFRKLGQQAYDTIGEILKLLRGGLTIQDNFNVASHLVTVNFGGVADTETIVSIATLKRSVVPTYILMLESNNGGLAYKSVGGTAWTATTIYLKSSKASTIAKVLVI